MLTHAELHVLMLFFRIVFIQIVECNAIKAANVNKSIAAPQSFHRHPGQWDVLLVCFAILTSTLTKKLTITLLNRLGRIVHYNRSTYVCPV